MVIECRFREILKVLSTNKRTVRTVESFSRPIQIPETAGTFKRSSGLLIVAKNFERNCTLLQIILLSLRII